jgi:RecB family exonuclease
MGIIDLLVVDKTGQIHIFDYKTSVRSYNNFDSAKKLAFTY